MHDLFQKEKTFLKNILFQYAFETVLLESTPDYHRIEIQCSAVDQKGIEEELKLAGCVRSPYKKGAYIKSLRWESSSNLPSIGSIQKSNGIEMVQYELLNLD